MIKQNHKCPAGGFLLGTIAGALLGAGLALLYAPKTGEDTRKEIKAKVEELKKESLKAKGKALAKVKEMKEDAVEKAEDIKGRAKRAAKELNKDNKEKA